MHHGLRPDLAAKLADGAFLVQLAAAWLTGATAVFASLALCLPDRPRAWLLLPLPSLALWLSGIGYACLTRWIAVPADAPMLAETLRCLETVILTSVPLSLLLWVMVRRARPLQPSVTAWTGGLAVAAFTTVSLFLMHDIDASVLVLAWNGGTVLLLAGLAGLVGRRALDSHPAGNA